MKRKIVISLVLGAVVSALGFYFAFRSVPFDELVQSMAGINYLWLIPGAGLGLVSFMVRTLRWQLILGSSLKLSFFSAFHPLMIGFLINSVLPGRIGELARPAIIRKQGNVPFSQGLTTIVAERIFDAITLMVLFAWVLATVYIDPDLQTEFRGRQLSRQTLEGLASMMIWLCIFLSAAAVTISIPKVQRVLKQMVLKAPFMVFSPGSSAGRKVQEKCCLPLTRVIDHVAAGLSMIRQPVSLMLCLVYSFAVWLLQALAIYVLAFGFPAIGLGFGEMLTVFIVICFFIMLPSVPGFWGLWEAGGVFGMALFGVSQGNAAGFSLLNHAMLMFPVLIVGVYSAAVTGVNILHVSYEGARKARETDI
ncbi:MAG: flippase-like domain-containing protein [Desulfobacteraceae bacterium]|nr:flippase-like domain-containing protein [Desulfobacteraceae bacterium]